MLDSLASLTRYERLRTTEVNVGGLLIGNFNPIRIQTMTTTDTMDTEATVAQCIRCVEAGAELVRITAPSKKEAENLGVIKSRLQALGFKVPLVADIHFTPNAAEIAARLIEKVRINPGNYVDKKKFEQIDYTDAEYQEELDRIRHRFTPLLKICKEYGTAMRIGTNHGSLSDRIMSRYGDTHIGMVESAMEFLRIARAENYHNIVLSMKASNPQVMVQAYRLLVKSMGEEFGICYPLHLGVTEAGDGEDGRVKSAVGIGTLLEEGIGDTVRVSLTEEPEAELPVCRELVSRYPLALSEPGPEKVDKKESPNAEAIGIAKPQKSLPIDNLGGGKPPVVIADFRAQKPLAPKDLLPLGYDYDPVTDKWKIGDLAPDFLLLGEQELDFTLPGTLKVIVDQRYWENVRDKQKYFPLASSPAVYLKGAKSKDMNFVWVDCDSEEEKEQLAHILKEDAHVVPFLYSRADEAMLQVRACLMALRALGLWQPVVLYAQAHKENGDASLIHFAIETGALLLDGMGDGICLSLAGADAQGSAQFLNTTAFSILQATRTRISKTEYISCPSCGRTLFDLQETTAKIRNRTHHLKGVKIAIMGCIVNGPGEMADADFGYVGSGVGKITLYKGKDVVKKGIDSEVAVDELIQLLKDNDAWHEPSI